MSDISFNYFHADEADQFTFYRIPKALFIDERFKGLSNDAKILYGLMLDRISLSLRNHWIDDEGRVYIIFSLKEIMECINCGKDKGVKVLAELDTVKGLGLIERIKRGMGDADLIYVKNFVVRDAGLNKAGKPKSETKNSEVGKTEVFGRKSRSLDSEKPNSEVGKTDPINTNNNKTYNNNTNNNKNNDEVSNDTSCIELTESSMPQEEVLHSDDFCFEGEIVNADDSSCVDGIPETVEQPVITLQLNTGEEYPVMQKILNEYQESYPAIDVMQELRGMKAWLISNPKLRKTKSGIKRFMNNWLSKSQNSATRYSSSVQGQKVSGGNSWEVWANNE